MDTYATTTTWTEIAQRVRAARRIGLVTHTKPDGDALGSLLALARAFVAPPLEKIAEIFLMGPIEPPLRTVAGDTPYNRVENEPPGEDYDLIIVVDTGAWSQLEPIADWLRRHHENVVVIDHHSNGDDVGKLRVVDNSAAAAAEMVTKLLDELECPITGGCGSVAEALFVGVATDTGWFKYPNAGAETFALAARLLALGVEKARLYRAIEESHRPGRLALEARALASLEFSRGGEVAIQLLGPSDFEATGCTIEDLTGIVNLPMIVGRVRVAILITEYEPSHSKISFRAKAPLPGEAGTDVNELARRFGGGGHVFASGARMDVGRAEARRAVLAALESMP